MFSKIKDGIEFRSYNGDKVDPSEIYLKTYDKDLNQLDNIKTDDCRISIGLYTIEKYLNMINPNAKYVEIYAIVDNIPVVSRFIC